MNHQDAKPCRRQPDTVVLAALVLLLSIGCDVSLAQGLSIGANLPTLPSEPPGGNEQDCPMDSLATVDLHVWSLDSGGTQNSGAKGSAKFLVGGEETTLDEAEFEHPEVPGVIPGVGFLELIKTDLDPEQAVAAQVSTSAMDGTNAQASYTPNGTDNPCIANASAQEPGTFAIAVCVDPSTIRRKTTIDFHPRPTIVLSSDGTSGRAEARFAAKLTQVDLDNKESRENVVYELVIAADRPLLTPDDLDVVLTIGSGVTLLDGPDGDPISRADPIEVVTRSIRNRFTVTRGIAELLPTAGGLLTARVSAAANSKCSHEAGAYVDIDVDSGGFRALPVPLLAWPIWLGLAGLIALVSIRLLRARE